MEPETIMSDAHACIICKKNTSKGRFTRPASGIGGAWTKNSLPAWYCYAPTCLPLGKGRGEDAAAAVKETVTVTPTKTAIVSPKAILADRTEGLARLAPVQSDVQQLPKVLTTKDEYDAADAVLGAVKKARKWWKERMYGTKATPGPIPSIKSGLDMLYALNNEVDDPLEEMEKTIKAKMVDYNVRDRRKLMEQEAELLRQRQEAERALEAAAAKEAAAKTPLQKAKAAAEVETAEAKYVETLDSPLEQLGQADNSSVRVPKKPTVSDVLAFCRGIADGEIPVECIELKQGYLNKLYRDDAETVTAFPGVTIIDDIQIIGRS
jgi:hypothetical protein